MTAHVGGLPVEEVVPAVLGGGGALLLVRLVLLRARLGGRRRARTGSGVGQRA